MSEPVVVARVGRAHGLRGEVTVQLHTDDPEGRLVAGAVLATEPPERGPLTIGTARVHQGVYLLGFEGYADRGAAESLRGTRLLGDPAGSEDDRWYEDDLLGYRVTLPDGTEVGEVSGLLPRPAQDLLQVRTSDGREVLVPFVAELVPEVDEAGRVVVVNPPEGLLELGD